MTTVIETSGATREAAIKRPAGLPWWRWNHLPKKYLVDATHLGYTSFDMLETCVVVLDQRDNLLYGNRSFFGLEVDAKTAIAHYLQKSTIQADGGETHVSMLEAVRSGRINKRPGSVSVSKEGPWFYLTVSPQQGLNNTTYTLVEIHDISDQVKSRREQIYRIKENMHVVSHEQRTPLTAIKGWTQLARRELAKSEPNLEFADNALQHVEDGADTCNTIIDDIVDEGVFEEQVSQVIPAEDIISKALSRNKEAIRLHNIRLICQPVEPHLRLLGDRRLLVPILSIPLANAIHAVQPDNIYTKEITIAYMQRGDRLFFFINDTGTGIPQEKQAIIFEGDSSKNGTGQGSGFGLRRARRLARLYGGDVSLVRSITKDALGDDTLAQQTNTTFAITLPLA